MICDYCIKIIKTPVTAFTKEKNGLVPVLFCSSQCKESSIKDRIEDEKYARKMRRAS